MAKIKGYVKAESTKKVTSIGCSSRTRFSNKNDKKNKKAYRGQGK